MNRCITDDNSEIKRPLNPKSNTNIFEFVTYSWMLNLFKTGQIRDLDETDLYTTLDDQLSSSLGDKLEKEWRIELINAYSANRKPSLLRALIKIFGFKYIFIGFVFAINEIFLKFSRIA